MTTEEITPDKILKELGNRISDKIIECQHKLFDNEIDISDKFEIGAKHEAYQEVNAMILKLRFELQSTDAIQLDQGVN